MYLIGDKFSMYRFTQRDFRRISQRGRKNKRFKFIARYTSCYRSITNHIDHGSITIYHEYASLKNRNRSMYISAYYTPNNYSFTDVVCHDKYDDNSYYSPPKGYIVSKTLLQLDEINNDNSRKERCIHDYIQL